MELTEQQLRRKLTGLRISFSSTRLALEMATGEKAKRYRMKLERVKREKREITRQLDLILEQKAVVGANQRPVNITEIPFNQFLGIKKASRDSGFVLELGSSPCFQNHLGTVHAGIQLALAEASSGECLLRELRLAKGRSQWFGG